MRPFLCRTLLFLVPFLLLGGLIAPQEIGVKVAFLAVDNLSGDPRYDYLSGITQGVFLYDLSRAARIILLDRSLLEEVLKEQELRLSGIADSQALEVGKLLGAEWLIKGGYVFLGEDVLLNVNVTDVTTGQTLVFSDRGSTENMVHGIAEKVIRRLSGEELGLVSANDRSIISLKDESPGTVALHSHLLDAKIYVDGEFIGYTTGDRRVPYLIEDLRAGPHTISMKLTNFGVVKEPEITFHDWEQTVEVKPGRRHVIQAEARHFNDILYGLKQLLREDLRIDREDRSTAVTANHDASFVDREGQRIPIDVRLETRSVGEALEARLTIDYAGEKETLIVTSEEKKEIEVEKDLGKVRIELSVDAGYTSRFEVDYSIWRTDIEQNMWY